MGKRKCRFRQALGIILTAGMMLSGVNFAALPVYAEEGGEPTAAVSLSEPDDTTQARALINNENDEAAIDAVHNYLKTEIGKIAAGTRQDTKIDVLDLIKDTDLQAAFNALKEKCKDINTSLLSECQNDLFWYEKEVGLEFSGIYRTLEDGQLTDDSHAYFSFAVSPDYQAADGDQYTVDSKKIESAQNILKSAQQIVNENAGKSDYEKLLAYKNEICRLASYNTAAAEPGYKESNNTDAPWQMIYVFDNDPDTNVVCEGYSKAFQYLCDLSKFNNAKCYTVTGEMSGGLGAGAGGGHMWNIVSLGGNNYLVDVTNCDENAIGAPDLLFLAVPASGSWNGSYTFSASDDVTYTYSVDSKDLFGENVLNLASAAYTPEQGPADDVTGKPGTDDSDKDDSDKDNSGSNDANNGSDKDSDNSSDKDSNDGSDKDSDNSSDKDSNDGSDKDSDNSSDKDANDDPDDDSSGTDSDDQTGNSNVVSGWTVEKDSSDPNTYRLDVSSTIKVSDELLNDENLNTPEKIENLMREGYSEQGISDENIRVYDVTLQIYEDGVWQEVTVENFPADGITIAVPYPSGTDSTYNFAASHLFTKSMNGFTAGQIETFPENGEIRKTASGISFTVHGLSPVSVGWSQEASAAESTDNTTNNTNNNTSGNTPNTSTGNTSGNTGNNTTNNTTTNNTSTNVSPRTGDFSPIQLYVALLVLAVAVMGIVHTKRIYTRKR